MKRLVKHICRCIHVFALAWLVVGCNREQTTYSPSFNHKEFSEIRLNTSIHDAVAAVGLPMRAWLYYTDNNPNNQSREITPLTKEKLMDSSRIPSSYVVCYYSVQGETHHNYVRCELYFVNGHLEKKLEALVTE